MRAGRATNDVIILNQLRKVYGGKKAAVRLVRRRRSLHARVPVSLSRHATVRAPPTQVRDLTFGIPQGQCFGFLGINGAGKTTTLRILSGDEIPTSGSATLGGFDIMREQPEVRGGSATPVPGVVWVALGAADQCVAARTAVCRRFGACLATARSLTPC